MFRTVLHVERGICRYSCLLLGYNSRAGSISSSLFSSKAGKAAKMALPRVYMDMAANDESIGRIVIEVSKKLYLFEHLVLQGEPDSVCGQTNCINIPQR